VRFEELLLVAGVEGAEGGVVGLAEHAAAAVVGKSVVAEFGVGRAGRGHLWVVLRRRFFSCRALGAARSEITMYDVMR